MNKFTNLLIRIYSRFKFLILKTFYKGNLKVYLDNRTYRVDFKSNLEFKRAKSFLKAEANFTRNFLDEVKNRSVFIDIGANVGHYSLAGRTINDKLTTYAFEPEPKNVQQLKKNIELNSFSDDIQIIENVLGDKKEKLKLNISSSISGAGMHSLVQHYEDDRDDHFIEVQSDTLDNFLDEEVIEVPDIVKIDVEGYEFYVLKGMRNILENYKPMIFIELHPKILESQGFSSYKVRDFLYSFNYESQNLSTKSTNVHQQNHYKFF